MTDTPRSLFREFVVSALTEAAHGNEDALNQVIQFSLADGTVRLVLFKEWAADRLGKEDQESIGVQQVANARLQQLAARRVVLEEIKRSSTLP